MRAPSDLGSTAGWIDHPLARRLLDPQQFLSAALVLQVGRYGLVSVAALVCDVAVFLALTTAGLLPAVAGIAGYGLGLLVHFALSTRFVFATDVVAKSKLRLLGEFAASGGIGLVLTGAIIAGMTERLQAAPVLAKLTAVIVSFVVVFVLRRSVVFAPTKTSTP